MKKVAIISAHPDDEVLGAGGTLLRHRDNGDQVIWIIVTGMTIAGGFSEERIAERNAEINTVSNKFGIQKTIQLNFPTISLSDESLPELIQQLSTIFTEYNSEVIYTPNRTDAHSDHRIVFEAAWACSKSFRYPFIEKFLMYECISETEFAPPLAERAFLPNYFVDVTKFVDEKDEIMNVYKSEVDKPPFPRSIRNIRALSAFRGSIAGTEYAEAFQLLKFIEK